MFKELFVNWLIKLVEIVAVIILSFIVCFVVGLITKETAIGIAVVGLVFYFFGGIIRPYIKDLQEKVSAKIGK